MSSCASDTPVPSPQLSEFVDGLAEGVVVIAGDWRITYVNRAALKMVSPYLGSAAERLCGSDYWTVFADLRGSVVEATFRRCMEERQTAELDAYFAAWGRWYSLRVAPAGASDISVFFQDVQERKNRELELQRREEKLRLEFAELDTIYRTAPVGLAVLDLDLRYVRINEHLAQINGRPAADHVGRRVREVMTPAVEDFLREKCRQLLETGEPLHFELEAATPDAPDNVRVWDELWYPLRDNAGTIAAYGAVVEEVTERRLRERRLSAEAKLLADAMPQLVWTAFANGTVDYYNERISAYAGARYENGRWHWDTMVHPDDAEPTRRAWERAVTTGETYAMTHRIRMKVGTYRWHLSRAVPVRDAAGAIVKWFGTATDIDEQKRLEERLEETVRQRTATLQETVAELETYSYSISHDMRAPLRAMHTFAHFLQAEYGDKLEGDGRNYLNRIIAAADRLDRLIQDVLAYSRVTRGEIALEVVDVAELVTEVIGTYPQFREADIRVVGPVPRVRANKAALTQCLSNLLGNAVKFARPGVPPVVEISAQRRGQRVAIHLRDNGMGIPAEAQARIFEMFFQHRPSGPASGTGIGLSIVRKAAERMGGRVYLLESSAAGSVFVLELAAAE